MRGIIVEDIESAISSEEDAKAFVAILPKPEEIIALRNDLRFMS